MDSKMLALVEIRSTLASGDFHRAKEMMLGLLDKLADSDERKSLFSMLSGLASISGNFDESVALAEQAREDADTLLIKARSLIGLGHYDEADLLFRRIRSIDPKNGVLETLIYLGHGEANKKGLVAFRELRERKLTEFSFKIFLCLESVKKGNLEEGFSSLYEIYRQGASRHNTSLFGKKLNSWSGEPVNHLLVIADDGFGDMFQFLRFVAKARKKCRRLTLSAPASMVRLLRDFADEVIDENRSLKALFSCDSYLPLEFSLPAVTRQYDYGEVPYIHAESSLDPSDRFRAGLCWTSSPDGANKRSLPVEVLSTLRDVPGVEFHSLIPGKGAEWMRVHKLDDWQDTAQLIAGLDLIITVDTAVAHLAGAMGKPVWIALHVDADWRWEEHPTKSNWYPTARLFRRVAGEEWAEVVARIKSSLTLFGRSV